MTRPTTALSASSSLGGNEVDTPEELDRLLDAIQALADEREVGQSLELRLDQDEALVVNISPTGEEGWGLMYDNSHTRSSTYSTNGSGSEEAVEVQWGGNWEEMEEQCFVAPHLARQAVHAYLTTGRVEQPEIEWVTVTA